MSRTRRISGESMAGAQVERVAAVDWSGDQSAAGQRRKIWAGVWTINPTLPAPPAKLAGTPVRKNTAKDGVPDVFGGRVTLESGRTREELREWLIAAARETPRMVVGVDFCFSYPAWFVLEHGARSGPEFWRIVAEHGERWLARACAEACFWGKVGPHRTGKKPAEFCGAAGALRMLRRADEACKVRGKILDPVEAAKVKGIAPKSPFQIGGAGAVGTGTLRGIPELERLHEAGFRVWPFEEPALRAKRARPLVVEIYPRLLTGEVHKGNAQARKEYLARKRRKDAAYAALPREVIEKARRSEDAFDALVSVMEMVARRGDFLRLKQTTDAITRMEGAVWGAKGQNGEEER